MNTRLPSALLMLAALCVGCDGLGRGVVDNMGGIGEGGGACNKRAPRCDDAPGAPEELDVGNLPGRQLSPCDLGRMEDAPRLSLSLRNCVLSLSAEAGEEREIARSELFNVRIELDSAVHLRVANSQLTQVELVAERGSTLGTLTITHSRLTSSVLSHDFVALISTLISRVRVEAAELSGVDLEAHDSLLYGAAMSIAGSYLEATRLGECDTILMARNGMINSSIDACSGVTRLYNVAGTGGQLDGELESDQSSFASARLGVRAPTQLHAWSSSLSNSVLCEGFAQLRVAQSSLTCVACQGPMASPDADVCSAASKNTIDSVSCEVLAEIEICDEFPERPRPIQAL